MTTLPQIAETERMPVFDPLDTLAARIRALTLHEMAGQPFADWPRLAARLHEEINDVERGFARFETEMRERGKND